MADPRLPFLAALHRKALWLSTWMIHNANHLRDTADGLKVGGHQASSASLATIMAALYGAVLRPQDRVAVKPHASPVFHALQYLFGNQTRDKLETFRAFKGAQSYPSRTKDVDDVDFSTGSVGLGVAQTLFSSLAQDYVKARSWGDWPEGRMVALVGDAEMDEGNIFEALLEGWKQGLRNCWWVVDYNRQSPRRQRAGGAVGALRVDLPELRMGGRHPQIRLPARGGVPRAGGRGPARLDRPLPEPALFGPLLPGRRGLAPAPPRRDRRPGRHHPADRVPFGRGARRPDDEPRRPRSSEPRRRLRSRRAARSPDLLHRLYDQGIRPAVPGSQGQSCRADDDDADGGLARGHGDQARPRMGSVRGPVGRRGRDGRVPGRGAVRAEGAPAPRRREDPGAGRPALPPGDKGSTQQGFGTILAEIAASGEAMADRIVTTAPDVTVSTNLGGWVNRRGLFAREEMADTFRREKIPSTFTWEFSPKGQHIELGIAEMNLFILLSALGLSHSINGERLLPIGTLYDPFIQRGLDALNYACYQDARFIVVATPSGVTLAPEGGAHQSIATPLIGLAQDGLAAFEPAFVDELAVIMRFAFDYMQRDGEGDPDETTWLRDQTGGSVYLRLSTRPLDQPHRAMTPELAESIVNGAYWLRRPGPNAEVVVAFMGAVAPEAIEAVGLMAEDRRDVGLLAVTSADRINAGWTAAERARQRGNAGARSHVERLLEGVSRECGLVTVVDGHPATLAWLGGVNGQKVTSLGVEHFGQTGTIGDLYRHHGIDANAIIHAAQALAPGRPIRNRRDLPAVA